MENFKILFNNKNTVNAIKLIEARFKILVGIFT